MLSQGKRIEEVLGTHIKGSACYGSMAPRMNVYYESACGSSGGGSKSMLG